MSIKDLVTNIKRNGLLASMHQLEELYRLAIESEEKLAVSQREFRAADATIENLQMQVEKLAAENAGLKAALRTSDIPSEWTDAFGDTAVIEHDATGDNQGHSVSWSWVGNQEEVIKSVLLAVDGSIKTPATDAFLAEVRAQGVEMFAVWNDKHIKPGVEHKESLTAVSHAARGFAGLLRKGAQS